MEQEAQGLLDERGASFLSTFDPSVVEISGGLGQLPLQTVPWRRRNEASPSLRGNADKSGRKISLSKFNFTDISANMYEHGSNQEGWRTFTRNLTL